MIDLSHARREPFAHQVEGVEWLLDLVDPDIGRVLPGCLLLADEMRLGKSKQVIDAVEILRERGEVDRAIVVAPAPVRGVWFDPELGELKKHLWQDHVSRIVEYHTRTSAWSWGAAGDESAFTWYVTNYEFVRSGFDERRRLRPLLDLATPRTVLVLDESSAVANHRALQSRALRELRARCGRVWLLNGTPMGDSPEDYFGQGMLMDWRILGCRTKTEFMARYAIMGGYAVMTRWGRKVPTQVLGWRHAQRPGCCEAPPSLASQLHSFDGIGDLQRRLAPYVLRRERKHCMDLPPKLEPVMLTATLTTDTWRVYKQLRDEFAVWLGEQTVINAAQAGVRAMRLAQVCSGFVGGVEELEFGLCERCGGSGEDPEHSGACGACTGLGGASPKAYISGGSTEIREVGREKLDVLLGHVRGRLAEEPDLRMIVWCRFRAEMERAAIELRRLVPQTLMMHGGQRRTEREEALRLVHPQSDVSGAAVLVATIGTGALGLNMSGAREVVFLSNSWSLAKRLQSEDRPVGPDQKGAISYHDVVAAGPRGQRTADHEILSALRDKENLASWTVEKWIRLLED